MVDEVTKFRFVVKTSYIVSCYQNARMLSLNFTGVSMLSRAWIRAWIGFDIFADDEPSRDDLRHVSRTFKETESEFHFSISFRWGSEMGFILGFIGCLISETNRAFSARAFRKV